MQSVLWRLLLLLVDMTAGFLVPNPPGKYNVTLTTGELIDYSRNNIYAPTPTPVALMLSIFQPAICESTVPVHYMPRKTAEYQGPFLEKNFNISSNLSPLFLDARLPVCHTHQSGSCSAIDDGPILLFSPGYGIPRLYYSVIASAIASEGFTVITIDHPNDANIIVYPDGQAVYYNASISDSPTLDEYPRAADASFIIDQLSNATAIAELLPQRGPRPFATDRVAMLGHSLGGASSVIAASLDPRIRAAIDWDGTIFGASDLPEISQPVLIMSHQNYVDTSWPVAWPKLKGPKLLVTIANTTHETFSDIPTLLQAAGQNTAPFVDLLGTIAPAEMVRILTAYTTAWMNGAFLCKEGQALLAGLESDKFPEVSTLMEGNF